MRPLLLPILPILLPLLLVLLPSPSSFARGQPCLPAGSNFTVGTFGNSSYDMTVQYSLAGITYFLLTDVIFTSREVDTFVVELGLVLAPGDGGSANIRLGLYQPIGARVGTGSSATQGYELLTQTANLLVSSDAVYSGTVLVAPVLSPYKISSAGVYYVSFASDNTGVYLYTDGVRGQPRNLTYVYDSTITSLPLSINESSGSDEFQSEVNFCPTLAVSSSSSTAASQHSSSSSSAVSSSSSRTSTLSSTVSSASSRAPSSSTSLRSSSATSSPFTASATGLSSLLSAPPSPSSSPFPSSSTGSAAAFSDPRFRGFWGQSFYVGGVAGGVYNLLSDAEVQINAAFVYLRNLTCPVVDGRVVDNCFQHEGTYFGSLLVRVRGVQWIKVVGGGVEQGFAHVQLSNGDTLVTGEAAGHHRSSGADLSITTTTASVHTLLSMRRMRRSNHDDRQRADRQQHQLGLAISRHGTHTTTTDVRSSYPTITPPSSSLPQLSVSRFSHRTLLVQAGVYRLVISNMDGYVDITALEVTCWHCLLTQLRPEGLLGQTWNATARMRHSDEEVSEYREREDDLLGCDHMHDRFCSASVEGMQRK